MVHLLTLGPLSLSHANPTSDPDHYATVVLEFHVTQSLPPSLSLADVGNEEVRSWILHDDRLIVQVGFQRVSRPYDSLCD